MAKLTAAQWRILKRASTYGGGLNTHNVREDNVAQRLCDKGLLLFARNAGAWVDDYKITDAGRRALEQGGSAQ